MSTNEPEVVNLDPAITATIREVVATDELPTFFVGPSHPCPS